MPTIVGWLVPNDRPTIYVARGRLYSLTQHFIPAFNGSAACLSPSECVLCDRSMPVQQLATVPVSLLGSERIHLLRILSSEREILRTLQLLGPSLIGTELEIAQLSPAQPNRLQLAVLSRSSVQEAPCEKYINAIGKKLYELMVSRLHQDPTLLDVEPRKTKKKREKRL